MMLFGVTQSRVWLCLALLVLHVSHAGCKTANVTAAELDGHDVVIDIDQTQTRNSEAENDPGGAAAVAVEANNENNTLEVDAARLLQLNDAKPKSAFLRKNNNKTLDANKTTNGRDIFQKALSRAIGGGIPGAIAGVIQVLSLMWLRTVINYQYRYGSSFRQALATLYGMGGIPRLYSGITFALIQAPLARFVSTAANDGVAVLLQNFNWGPGREVVVAAVFVGLFRMVLMPIDTCKTVLQIESSKGLASLMSKVRKGHINLLYSGALANALSSFIGHYPWFYVYNSLSRNDALIELIPWVTGRNAMIGFMSSIVSDTVANFMRVIKTTKQALGSTRSETTYRETISLILAVDGWRGLFGRGLKTRILGNALQSIMFTVVWRGLSEKWQNKDDESNDSTKYEDDDDDDIARSSDYKETKR